MYNLKISNQARHWQKATKNNTFLVKLSLSRSNDEINNKVNTKEGKVPAGFPSSRERNLFSVIKGDVEGGEGGLMCVCACLGERS